ncbi:MAG: DUF4175 domain-containing protein [Alphaproteobacteria bacterium]
MAFDGHERDGCMKKVRIKTPSALRKSAAWSAIAWERAWPAWLPAASVVMAFLALAWTGILPALGGIGHAAVLFALAAALVVALIRYTPAVDWPSAEDVTRRLERDSKLEHRPLEVQQDELPADLANDPLQAAIFRRHQQRMAEKADKFRVSGPIAPELEKKDPLDLRFALIILLVIGFVAARDNWANRIETALQPDISLAGFGQNVQLDVWASPPDYTGIAPVFLELAGEREVEAARDSSEQAAANGQAETLVLPQGTVVEARVTGGRKVPVLVINGVRLPFEVTDQGSFSLKAELESGTRLAVSQGRRTLGEWDIRVTPDQAPEVVLESLAPESGGATVITWTAKDDYGLATATALMELKGEVERPERFDALTVDLPFSGSTPDQIRGRTVRNLAAHPFAGLEVEAVIEVADQADQMARSEARRFVLAEREFTHPVARKLIELRKDLIRTPYSNRARIAAELRWVADGPEAFDDDIAMFLALYSAARRLEPRSRGSYDDKIMPVAGMLWDMALRLEDGSVGLAKERLDQALRDLREALESGEATPEELERLTEEAEKALQDYMAELAQEMMELMPDISEMEIPEDAEIMDLSELGDLLRSLEDMAETGAEDGALSQLERMEEMLEQMERGAESLRNGENDPSQQQAEMGPWKELLEDLQSIIEYQEELQQQSFTEAQRRGQLDRMGRPFTPRDELQQKADDALAEAIERMQQNMRDQGFDMPPLAPPLAPPDWAPPMPMPNSPSQQDEQQREQASPADDAWQRALDSGRFGENMPPMPTPDEGLAEGEQMAEGTDGEPINPPLSPEGAEVLQNGARLMLGDLMRRMGELMEEGPPEPFGEAEMAMRDAEEQLGAGQFGQSLPPQALALEKLREGAQEYMEAMQEAAGQGGAGGMVMMLPGPGGRRPGMMPGPGNRPQGTDPLGREPGGETGMVTDQDDVPDKPDLQRSREILDELRRRAGELDRPTEELDYINRLLDRF